MTTNDLIPAMQHSMGEPGTRMSCACGHRHGPRDDERAQTSTAWQHARSLAPISGPYDATVLQLLVLLLCAPVDGANQRANPAPQPSVPSVEEASATPVDSAAASNQRVDKRRRFSPPLADETTPWDRFRVVYPVESASLLAPSARAGRVAVFLKAVDVASSLAPSAAPFLSDPQPVGSIEVKSLVPGSVVELGESARWWPEEAGRLLEGTYEVQAIFDSDASQDGHLSPGNLFSVPVLVEFHRHDTDEIECTLSARIEDPAPPDARRVTAFECESSVLSADKGRRVSHRAWLAFPREYGDLNARRRVWPTVYTLVSTGMGPRIAERIALGLGGSALKDLVPQAVHVVIEEDGVIVDGLVGGPRATALVTEFIPCLEKEYRLVSDARARIVTGHGNAGWSAVWLLLEHPEVFGAAFSSAPAPLDFSAFGTVNIYSDRNLFVDADGVSHAAFREAIGPAHDLVTLSVEDEVGWSRALSPNGHSGQAWDLWESRCSDRDTRTGRPRRIADASTGEIDPVAVESWSRFDVAKRLASAPSSIGTLLSARVRILVGARDSFYFDRPTMALRDRLNALARACAAQGEPLPDGPGYIEVIEGASHDAVMPLAQVRFGREMQQHFRRCGLHE